MDLTEKYRDCKFTYSIPLLRAIEGAYHTAYQNGIVFNDRKGREYTIADKFSIAEFLADYSRACSWLGIKVGRRTGYKKIERMVNWLNGRAD